MQSLIVGAPTRPRAVRQRRAEGRDARADVLDAYPRLRDDLFAYAAGMLRDRAAAEDAVADTFERALTRLGQFDPRRGALDAWLWGICRHRVLDVLRVRRAEPLDAAPEPAAEDPLPAHDPALIAAVRGLADADRELVFLRFWTDLPVAEIAAVLEITPNACSVRLHRLLHRLATDLEEVSR